MPPNDEDLSEEGKETLRRANDFYESESRKRYSARRLFNKREDYEAAAEEGLGYLRAHGREFYQNLIDYVTSGKKPAQ